MAAKDIETSRSRFWRWRTRFRDARFNQKLTVLSMFTSLVALCLTGASLIALDLAAQKRSIEQNLAILSRIVGSNSSAALLFDDPKAARETLAGLSAQKAILSAAIYDRTGKSFATFNSDSSQELIPERVQPDERRFETDAITLTAPIIFQNERIGSIFLRYDLYELSDRLRTDLAVVGVILIFSFFISIFLSSKLKNLTSGPILHLADIARQVTVQSNYSLRATQNSGDELGKLTEDFNAMLDEVQRRDQQKSAAEKKFSFLAEASTILARSLDYRSAVEEVARFSIPYLADWCIVDLRLSDESHLEFAVTRHEASSPSPLETQAIVESGKIKQNRLQVLETGKRKFGQSERSLCSKNFLSVPMIARDQIVGALTFVSNANRPPYEDAQFGVAEDLAMRSAFAVDNSQLYQRAEEAIRLRDEFISIASHELKTPLTTLQLQVQSVMNCAISGNMGALPREKLVEMQSSAQRQIAKFSRLIGDLLDVSRLSTGKVKLELESLNLIDLVRHVIEEISLELERAGCTVEFKHTASVFGFWDRMRVEQVVSNLMTNAAKYGAGKSIILHVSQVGQTARITVTDFGIGIGKQDQRRIFERFERAVSVRHFGGFGLGLFIAQQNVAAHGGKIWVESEPGKGATFSFEIPLRPIMAQTGIFKSA